MSLHLINLKSKNKRKADKKGFNEEEMVKIGECQSLFSDGFLQYFSTFNKKILKANCKV